MKEGGVYYFIIDNHGKRKLSGDRISTTFSNLGNNEMMETNKTFEDQDVEVDSFIIFLLNGVKFRGIF